MKRMFVCAATLLLAGANGTRAEETLGSPTTPHRLPDTIVVSANRVPTSIDQVANSVTIITRKQIEQCRFPCVGISHQRHLEQFLTPLALRSPLPIEFRQLLFEMRDLRANLPAVDLQLRLTRSLGADATILFGEMHPCAG